MELANLVGIAFKIGLVLLGLGIGLRAEWADLMYLFRRPRLLFRSMLARNVVMPVAAILLVSVFRLEPVVAAVLLALSVTAVPPFLPLKLEKAGGQPSYDLGLFASQILLAIVLIPVTIQVVNLAVGTRAHFSAGQVASNVGQLILLPLGLGLLIGHLAPARRAGLAKAAGRVAMALLLVAGLVILGTSYKAMIGLIGNGTLIAMILFVLVGLAAGHILGGPRNDDRTALALAAASSHPGLAIAVVATNAPDQARLATAAVLLYLIVNAILARPYVARQRAAYPAQKLSRSGADRRRHQRAGPDRRAAVT